MPPDRVYLTEYFDPTRDSDGELCASGPGHLRRSLLTVHAHESLITVQELETARGGRDEAQPRDSRASPCCMDGTSSEGSHDSFSQTHGYCARKQPSEQELDRRAWRQSILRQGDVFGTLHPNETGPALLRDAYLVERSTGPSTGCRRPSRRHPPCLASALDERNESRGRSKACTRRRFVASLVSVVSLLALPAWFAQPALASHQPTHNEWFGFYRVEIGNQVPSGEAADELSGYATFFVPQDGYLSLSANLAVELPGRGTATRACSASRGLHASPPWRGDDTHDAASAPIGLDVTGRDQAGPTTGYSIKRREIRPLGHGDALVLLRRGLPQTAGMPSFHQPPRQQDKHGQSRGGFRFRGGLLRAPSETRIRRIYAGSTTPSSWNANRRRA